MDVDMTRAQTSTQLFDPNSFSKMKFLQTIIIKAGISGNFRKGNSADKEWAKVQDKRDGTRGMAPTYPFILKEIIRNTGQKWVSSQHFFDLFRKWKGYWYANCKVPITEPI